MGKQYQSKLFKFLSVLQKDLNDKKINKEQFDMLLGLFIRTELNKFVSHEIQGLLPENENKIKQMTFVSYKKSHDMREEYAS